MSDPKSRLLKYGIEVPVTEDESPMGKMLTPEQVAERIRASSGVKITPRTIWDKARRIGIAKKLGRECFILLEDIAKLLDLEPRRPDKAKAARLRHDRALKASAPGKTPAVDAVSTLKPWPVIKKDTAASKIDRGNRDPNYWTPARKNKLAKERKANLDAESDDKPIVRRR